jgi:hypothetical protein
MTFTETLFSKTKSFHMQVDKHQFTYLIKNNKKAGDLYIDFNKLCIHNIFKTLLIKDKILANKIKKEFICPNINISNKLDLLLLKCQELPLEHSYMFILGLVSGGNLLKKYISIQHHPFLTFEKGLAQEFKHYLNNNSDIDKELFIENVIHSYILIKEIFDEFKDNQFN